MSCRSLCGGLLVGLFGGLLTGCGESGPKLVEVSGKVLLDGTPLAKGGVRFVPDKEKGNAGTVEPVGMSGADGTYTLTTAGKPGAPAGWYRVTVTAQGGEIPDSTKPFANKSVIPARYGDPVKSGLTVEVVPAAAAGAYDLRVLAK